MVIIWDGSRSGAGMIGPHASFLSGLVRQNLWMNIQVMR